MGTDDFSNEIKRLRRPLQFFFYEKFRDAGKLSEMKDHVNELIQDTAIRAWINYQKPTSVAYKISKLIYLAAEDVWVMYIKPRKKDRHVFYEPEKMEEFFGSYEMIGQLEAMDYLSHIPAQQDPMAWEMLSLRAIGHTYKQISVMMQVPQTTVRDTIVKSQKKLNAQRLNKPPSSSK